MICETALQVHIRRYGKSVPHRVFLFGVWVQTTKTPCHLAGERAWFLCPFCGRRCAILYPKQCRKCAGGRYAKELMNPRSRKIQMAIDLRTRLGQSSGGTLAPFPAKPKWMRWRTYLRLRAKSEALESEIWAAEHFKLFGW